MFPQTVRRLFFIHLVLKRGKEIHHRHVRGQLPVWTSSSCSSALLLFLLFTQSQLVVSTGETVMVGSSTLEKENYGQSASVSWCLMLNITAAFTQNIHLVLHTHTDRRSLNVKMADGLAASCVGVFISSHFFVSSKWIPTCTLLSPWIIIIIISYYYYYYLIQSILILSQFSFFMNHHSGDRHVRMLLFGLLNGLGQCLQYKVATTQWQHRVQKAVGLLVEEGEEGKMVELNKKLKEAQRKNDKQYRIYS